MIKHYRSTNIGEQLNTASHRCTISGNLTTGSVNYHNAGPSEHINRQLYGSQLSLAQNPIIESNLYEIVQSTLKQLASSLQVCRHNLQIRQEQNN